MEKYYSIITTVGAAKLAAAAIGEGKPINVTEFVVGDGGGAYVEPNPEQTELVDCKWTGSIKKFTAEGDRFIVETTVPEDVGDFYIREIGFKDSEGTLIAVGSIPEVLKVAGKNFFNKLDIGLDVKIVNAKAITFTVEKYTYDYAYCRSSGEAAEKEAVCDEEFALYKGQHAYVVFDNVNTAAEAKLNVNKTGAYPIYNKGVAILPDILEAGNTYLFVFDGEHYNLIGDIKHRHTDLEKRIDDVANRGIVYEEETKTLSLSSGGTLGGGSSGGSGGGEGYILPVATKSRLGGVIIGEGISSEGDGRISPDYDSVVAKVAESYEAITEDDIKQAFEKEG